MFGGEVEVAVAPSPLTKVAASRTVYRVDVYNPVTDSWREDTVRRPAAVPAQTNLRINTSRLRLWHTHKHTHRHTIESFPGLSYIDFQG